MSGVSDAGSVRVICGPTATGKSTLAMQLALRLGARIISADSRQIYRGFNIGTAKPATSDRASVLHYCLDVVDPHERYSAAAWAKDAEHAIQECILEGSAPLVVGGTGFYLRALFNPLFSEPELDAHRVSALRNYLNTFTTDELHRWCRVLDAPRSHLGRAQLQRAVEVSLLSGEPLSRLQQRERRPPTWRARYLLVDSGRLLQDAIEKRVLAMFGQGWEAEVAILDSTLPSDAPAWKSTGYRVVRDMLHGDLERGAAVSAIVTHTRQYAKRQRTWFRNQMSNESVTIVDGSAPDLFQLALEWWNDEERN